jgi:hypothetical protein
MEAEKKSADGRAAPGSRGGHETGLKKLGAKVAIGIKKPGPIYGCHFQPPFITMPFAPFPQA